ncbi:hypothetical protein ACKAMS_15285 [Rhodococcus sp. 5A-K4]|uniref:hypothetical protein n=1 Tax=Rhodococcus sp. 5A-K4 TaxID=3384442 RepID=UPI0038D3720F
MSLTVAVRPYQNDVYVYPRKTAYRPLNYDAVAFGGGTPTSLDASGLDRMCDIAEFRMGADLSSVLV